MEVTTEEKPYPWYYAVNDRPVKIVELPDGGIGAFVFDWKSGNFVPDRAYLSHTFPGSGKDVDVLSEAEFDRLVTARRADVLRYWIERLCRLSSAEPRLTLTVVAAALGVAGELVPESDYVRIEPPPLGANKVMLLVNGEAGLAHVDVRHAPGLTRADLDARFGEASATPEVGAPGQHELRYQVAVRDAPHRCTLFARFESPPDPTSVVETVILRLDRGVGVPRAGQRGPGVTKPALLPRDPGLTADFICPVCRSPALAIVASIELPRDSRSDEITVQVVQCGACRMIGAATYEESRRGSLGSDHWSYQGYCLQTDRAVALFELIRSCPTPTSAACTCAAHEELGRANNHRWVGLEPWGVTDPFEMARAKSANEWFEDGMAAIRLSYYADYRSEFVGDLERAVEAFEKAVAAEPAHLQALHQCGLALALLNRHEEALDAFVAAASLAPADADLGLAMAQSLETVGQTEAALAAFDRVLRLRPGDEEAQFGRASALMVLERDELAIAAWDEVLGRPDTRTLTFRGREMRALFGDFRRLRARLSRAHALGRLGRPEALTAFREVFDAEAAELANSPTHGWLLEALRTIEVARSAYHAHLEARGGDASTWWRAGKTWLEAGRSEEAIHAWNRLVEQLPTEAEAWLGKAKAHVQAGQIDDAFAAYERSRDKAKGVFGS